MTWNDIASIQDDEERYARAAVVNEWLWLGYKPPYRTAAQKEEMKKQVDKNTRDYWDWVREHVNGECKELYKCATCNLHRHLRGKGV